MARASRESQEKQLITINPRGLIHLYEFLYEIIVYVYSHYFRKNISMSSLH